MPTKIEITGQATSRDFTNSDTGQVSTFYNQEAYLHQAESKYPLLISLSIESLQKQYPVGFYHLDFDNSIYVARYGQISLARNLKLIPLKTEQK